MVKRIYLIERIADYAVYDEAMGFVVVATSPKRAIQMTIDNSWGDWEFDRSKIVVTVIGCANNQIKEGIVLEDSRAG